MLLRLSLLFIVIPLVELYLLISVGEQIGILPTIAIVIFTGILGAYLAKTQGLMVMRRFWSEVRMGHMPAEELIHGLLIIIAGVVLLTPGFMTDIVGFLLLIPASRNALFRRIKQKIEIRTAAKGFSVSPQGVPPIDVEDPQNQ